MNQERRNCGRKNHRNYKKHTYERTDSIVPAAWLCNDISSAVYVPIFICAGARVEGGGRNVVECVQSGFLFRKVFVLAFYTAMLLFRTLLNRDIWANPLSDVIGGAICWIGYKVKSNNKPL